MVDSEKSRNIRTLLFLENEISLLRRVSEQYVANAPIGATRQAAAAYVEPYINKISSLQKSIESTRRELIGRGVDVPKEWANLQFKLASRRNSETGSLELDPVVVSRWEAVSADIEATIEQLQYAPEETNSQPKGNRTQLKSAAAQSSPIIPPEFRTVAMSKSRAAGYLRDGNRKSAVRWLTKCIKDGTISCETLSPQSYVFDVRQFPEAVRGNISPK